MNFCKDYLYLIKNEYENINLTRILEENDFYIKQYLDSIYPIVEIPEVNKIFLDFEYIIDVGFGGGFPILPLANKFKTKKIYGIEARNKKTLVVTQIAKKMHISNISLHHQRLEDLLIDKKCLLLFKAVGKIEDFLSLIKTDNKTEIVVFFYKGPSVDKHEKTIIKKWDLVNRFNYKLNNTETRNFFIYSNKKNLNVPHGTFKTKKIKNNFAKLSKLA